MILEVQNGCFGYPKQPVILENINLRLEEGHILAILGPNGIGKTTLLKCMIGLLPWHSGKTLFYGKDLHTLKPKDVWSTISYIPQSRGFAFSYTGLEMVLLGRSAHLGTFQQPGKEEIEMAEAMMERVGITRLANKDCNRMSGGELQMVLIARALINEPKLIILDEPETGLDFHNQILVLNLVERLAHESGISAIMNTHYPTNAMSVADEALMLNRKGEFFYGPAAEISTHRRKIEWHIGGWCLCQTTGVNIDLLDVEICRQSHRRAVLQAVQERFNASDDTHIGKMLIHFDLQVGFIAHLLLEQV